MIWLTWRQHRKQALYTLIALAAVAAVMVPTGIAMHHAYTNTGLAACLAKLPSTEVISGSTDTCGTQMNEFHRQFGNMAPIGILFLILPALVGLFFGAPLVAREVEHGTHRLVWTQGVSRRHWAAVKFGLIAAVTLLYATAYTLGMDWWSMPLIASGGRMGPLIFDFQGAVAIAYTLFAVALGVFVGTVSKKVLPAMGITLAGYPITRVLIETLARPRYATAQSASYLVTSSDQFNGNSGSWVYSQGIVNAAGKLVQPNAQMSCGNGPSGGGAATSAQPAAGAGSCGDQLLAQGLGPAPFSNWEQYQPASRFWEFQGIESGIFLALTAILFYLAIRRIQRIS